MPSFYNILVVCNFIDVNPLNYLVPNKYGISIQIRIRSLWYFVSNLHNIFHKILHNNFLLKCPYTSYNESFKMIRIHCCGGSNKNAPQRLRYLNITKLLKLLGKVSRCSPEKGIMSLGQAYKSLQHNLITNLFSLFST